jgi:hypothetical protein
VKQAGIFLLIFFFGKQGFRWLCNKLVRKSRSQPSDCQEIPAHLRQVLEACFDKYDEFQRQCQGHVNADDEESMALGLSSTMGRMGLGFRV